VAGANSAIGRATSTSSLEVGRYVPNVVVRIARSGADGYQVIETVVRPDGTKTVVQIAYDSSGRVVHYDPKTP
jgi:hypothetical protein